MLEASFSKDLNLPIGGGAYIKLTKQGQKIKFRIAGTPQYETKHFLGGKEVVNCERYNSDDPNLTCKYCEDYEQAVEIGDEETAKQIKPSTSFYYPILDLSDDKGKVFQFTAKSIHYGIKNYADEGVDVFACDWSVERTEESGPNYYKLLRLDGKPLSKEQKDEMEKAKTLLVKGKQSQSVSKEQELTPEEVESIMSEGTEGS